jgi:hypothetical protein
VKPLGAQQPEAAEPQEEALPEAVLPAVRSAAVPAMTRFLLPLQQGFPAPPPESALQQFPASPLLSVLQGFLPLPLFLLQSPQFHLQALLKDHLPHQCRMYQLFPQAPGFDSPMFPSQEQPPEKNLERRSE